MDLSEATKNLIGKYNVAKQKEAQKNDSPTIHVDEVALKVAAFYEKIRTVVEWKEEHLMRKAAIMRKLKRRFFDLQMSENHNIAEPLIFELIRGGHFENDKIEESKIRDVQKIIDKYVFILKNSPENREGKAGMNFYNWLLEVASCEIEDILAPAIREMALINYMFEAMREKINVPNKIYELGLLEKDERGIQIYIAVCQALFKLDKPIISYNLIKYRYPKWNKAEQDLIERVSENIFETYKQIEKDLKHPLANKFYYICEKYDTPYLLLGDVLAQNESGETIKDLSNPEKLESKIKSAYSKRLSTLSTRMSRAAIYSTISIFVTKVLSLVLLELLIDKFVGGGINPIVLIADVLIPTILMFLIVFSAKKPSSKNLNTVVMETMKVAYKTNSGDTYEIKTARKKSLTTRIILSLVYVFSSVASFGIIYFTLRYFGFPLTSVIVDIIFIALILFTGTAVTKRAQELTVEDEKEGFIEFLADVFFLPVQGLGKWISNTWKQYNAIAALFNALIDMPFSAFVEFLEGWRYFIKERKEEIR